MMSWTVFRMVSVVVLVGWSVGIWGRPPPAEAQSLAGLAKEHAALVFDGSAADGAWAEALAVGGPVRCQTGQRVGVWVEQVPAGGLPRLAVEGCEVGMVVADVAGGGDAFASRAIAGVRITASAAAVPACQVGLWLRGRDGHFAGNVVIGCQYGIIVSGDGYMVQSNSIHDSLLDGILVTGDWNTLWGNEVLRSKRHGINVIAAVPLLSAGVALPVLQDPALGNTIMGNVVLGSRAWDVRQWPTECPSELNGNTWHSNVFRTRNTCLN